MEICLVSCNMTQYILLKFQIISRNMNTILILCNMNVLNMIYRLIYMNGN